MKTGWFVTAIICIAFTIGWPLYVIHHLRPGLGITFASVTGDIGIMWGVIAFSAVLAALTTEKGARAIWALIVIVLGATIMFSLTSTLVPRYLAKAKQYEGPCWLSEANYDRNGDRKSVGMVCPGIGGSVKGETRQPEMLKAVFDPKRSHVWCSIYTDGAWCRPQ